MKLRDWMGRDITTLREDAEFDEPVATDAYDQEEEFSKDDAEVDDTVTEDAEEEVDVEVDGDDVVEDDADAFDKEFMKDDTDEEPVEVTAESVKWDNLFR